VVVPVVQATTPNASAATTFVLVLEPEKLPVKASGPRGVLSA